MSKSKSKASLKSASLFMLLILLASSFQLSIMIQPVVATPTGWWDTDYGYRKTFNVTSGTAITNYTLELIINYGEGSDSGNAIYLANTSQADFDDIRFINSANGTLSAWLEEKTDSDHAHVWINFDSLSSGNTTFNIYYGNSSVSNNWDITKAFVFGDDFEDDDYSTVWNTSSGTLAATITESSGILSMNYTGNNGNSYGEKILKSGETFNSSISYQIISNLNAVADVYHTARIMFVSDTGGHNVYTGELGSNDPPKFGMATWDGSDYFNYSTSTIDAYTQVKLMMLSGTSITAYETEDDVSKSLASGLIGTGETMRVGVGVSAWQTSGDNYANIYLKWLGVTKYLAVAPTFNYWGEAENVNDVEDATAPTFGAGTNLAAYATAQCTFSIPVYDDVAPSYVTLQHNNTGTAANETWISVPSNATTMSFTITLNSTVGSLITYKFFANDSSNNVGASSDYNLTTLEDTDAPTFGSPSNTSQYAGGTSIISIPIYDNANASYVTLQTNNTGSNVNETWISVTSNGTAMGFTLTLNDTVGSIITLKFFANDSTGNVGASDDYNITTEEPWLEGFTYRTPITVNQTDGADVNYTIGPISVSSGITLNFERVQTTPFLNCSGVDADWDGINIAIGATVNVGDQLYIYLFGQNSSNYMTYGLANVSQQDDNLFPLDTSTWSWNAGNPILMPNGSYEWEHASTGSGIRLGTIIKLDNGTYYLYYSINSDLAGNRGQIGLMTSSDCLNWERYSGNPIVAYNDSNSEYHVGIPDVIEINSSYYVMYYTVSEENDWGPMEKINIATSTDGVAWTKTGTAISLGGAGELDGTVLEYHVTSYINGYYVLIYEGYGGDVEAGTDPWHILAAISSSPTGPFTKIGVILSPSTGSYFDNKHVAGGFPIVATNGTLFMVYGGTNTTENYNNGPWYQGLVREASYGDIILDSGKVQYNFGDVRLTSSDGFTEIPYYITNLSVGSADIYFKVPGNLTESNQTIYMYYGNSTAATTSDGINTFIFFDDFNRADNATVGNGWTETETHGNASILNNALIFTSDGAGTASILQNITSQTRDLLWETYLKDTAADAALSAIYYIDDTDQAFGLGLGGDGLHGYLNASGWITTADDYVTGQFYKRSMWFKEATNTSSYYLNDAAMAEDKLPYASGVGTAIQLDGAARVGTTTFDWVWSRYHVATDPIITLGEESGSSTLSVPPFTITSTSPLYGGTWNATTKVLTFDASASFNITNTGGYGYPAGVAGGLASPATITFTGGVLNVSTPAADNTTITITYLWGSGIENLTALPDGNGVIYNISYNEVTGELTVNASGNFNLTFPDGFPASNYTITVNGTTPWSDYDAASTTLNVTGFQDDEISIIVIDFNLDSERTLVISEGIYEFTIISNTSLPTGGSYSLPVGQLNFTSVGDVNVTCNVTFPSDTFTIYVDGVEWTEYTNSSALITVANLTAGSNVSIDFYLNSDAYPVTCTEILVDDTRLNINSNATLNYHLVFTYNSSDIPSGTININGTSHSITSGWANFTVTNASVVNNTYVITDTNCTQVPANPWVIFDQLYVYSLGRGDDRAAVGKTAALDAQLRFRFDDASLTSGTVIIGDKTASWDGTYARSTQTYASIANVTYNNVTVTNEPTYNITSVDMNGEVEWIIWDKLNITLVVSDSRIDINSNATITASATFEFDGSAVAGWYYYNLNDTTTKATVGSVAYLTLNASDSVYHVNSFDSVNVVSVVFDRVNLTASLDDSRINIGENATVSITGVYAYDGSAWPGAASLNSTDFNMPSVGIAGYTVDNITDPTYGLSEFNIDPFSIIWDRVICNVTVADSTIGLNTNASISVSGIYDYDDSAFDGTFTLNNTVYSYSTPQTQVYEVSSIAGGTHGITSLTTDYVSVEWADEGAPTFGDGSSNATEVNKPGEISIPVYDDVLPSFITFMHNNSGVNVNETWTAVPSNGSTMSFTIPALNSTPGMLIVWQAFANDTVGNVGASSQFNFTTTASTNVTSIIDGNFNVTTVGGNLTSVDYNDQNGQLTIIGSGNITICIDSGFPSGTFQVIVDGSVWPDWAYSDSCIIVYGVPDNSTVVIDFYLASEREEDENGGGNGITPPVEYHLTIELIVGGPAHGTVTPMGGYYSAGTSVDIAATPDTGYYATFMEHLHTANETHHVGNTYTVIMDSDHYVRVEFDLIDVGSGDDYPVIDPEIQERFNEFANSTFTFVPEEARPIVAGFTIVGLPLLLVWLLLFLLGSGGKRKKQKNGNGGKTS